MSIFGDNKVVAEAHKDILYSKDMLSQQLQKEAQRDFNDQIRRFKDYNGFTRHLTNDIISLLRSQAIQFKLEEQKQFKL